MPPNGPVLARSTSTWIHWWSSVASANVFTRSWVISSQSLAPEVGAGELAEPVESVGDGRHVSLPSGAVNRDRSSFLITLPEAVRGKDSAKTTDFGILYLAIRPSRNASSSAGVDRRALAEHHDRAADLAPVLVRHADHRALGDGRMLVQRVLHLGRVDVLAARDDQILDAVPDVDEAVVVGDRRCRRCAASRRRDSTAAVSSGRRQ